MLKTRIITAVISLLVLGAVLFVVPAIVAEAVIALLVLAGAWEWAGFLNLNTAAKRLIYVAATATALGLAYAFFDEYAKLILQLACVWWSIAFIWTFFFPTAIPMFLRWLCGLLALVPLYVALKWLYSIDAELLLFALLIVWAADVGAYFAGKAFGRVKLAPSISPGKTWEGVFGGLLVVLGIAVAYSMYRQLPIVTVVPFCMGVAALSVVGDLTVSMFKRTAGVKDSGALFPGHGGVLDRIDSVSAAAPLFTLGFVGMGLT